MMRIQAFQDLTGVKLEGDIEIHGAPVGPERGHEAFRFLFWVDDVVLGEDGRQIRSIVAVDTNGKREPVAVFRCTPNPEGAER